MASSCSVAMICRRVYPASVGGTEIHTYYVTKELARHSKVFLISEGELPIRNKNQVIQLRIRSIPVPVLSSISFVFLSLLSLLPRGKQISVLHAQGALSPAVVGAITKRLLKTPLVITCHGSEVRLQKSVLIRALQMLAFSTADKITTVSNEMKGIIVSRYGVERSRISIVPNGYDKDLLQKCQEKSEKASVYGKIAYVGRLSYPKDPVTLLRGFEQAHRVLPEISLCLVGDGGLRPILVRFCRDHKLSEAVQFLGRLPHSETLRVMAQSTIFAISSYEEGMPMVLMEAMALGKPVIATAVGGIPEVVKDGMNGVLVPLKSSEHIARALERLMTNLELRRKLGVAAAESVKTYTWSKIAEKYEIIYQEALRLEARGVHDG